MIIPISNGKTITPVYIPQPVTSTNYGDLEHNYTNTHNGESSLGDWVAVGVIIIFLIVFARYFVKLLKRIFGGKE